MSATVFSTTSLRCWFCAFGWNVADAPLDGARGPPPAFARAAACAASQPRTVLSRARGTARNVSLNPSVQHRVSSQELDWNWAPNAIREAACGLGPVRLVLASDCVWLADQVDAFVSVACALCPDTQRLLICQQRRSRMLEEALWGALEAAGFEDAAPKWSSEDGLIAIRELRRRAVYEGSRALFEK